MSDHFQMLVDEDVTLDEAPAVSANVITALRDRELITGDLTPDCVLGGNGFRIGQAIPTIYTLQANECRFWDLATSGIEPSIKRSFNYWALGPSCEYLVCPNCDQKHEEFDSPFGDAVFEAVGQWHDQSGAAIVSCPSCGNKAQITDWQSKPPLGFGNMSFHFWNWPPFDLPNWKLDIPALFHEITGHSIVITWGDI